MQCGGSGLGGSIHGMTGGSGGKMELEGSVSRSNATDGGVSTSGREDGAQGARETPCGADAEMERELLQRGEC